MRKREGEKYSGAREIGTSRKEIAGRVGEKRIDRPVGARYEATTLSLSLRCRLDVSPLSRWKKRITKSQRLPFHHSQ